jgi:deazaflavin-dependent oxidoreductase (nitroreductase family)
MEQAEGAARTQVMTGERPRPVRLPPRRLMYWSIRCFGAVQRSCYRLSAGRLGLSRPRPDRWGEMCLKTVGRRTGKARSVILGYYEDGRNLVLLTVNAWADTEPAWWTNLQAHPDAVAELRDGSRLVRARAAAGDERARLWARWRELGERSGVRLMADIDGFAARLSREMTIVVLEPRPG